MTRKAWAIVFTVLFMIVAGFAYLLLTPAAEEAVDKMASGEKTQTAPAEDKPAPASPEQPGAYITYSDRVVAETPGTKLLFFHAPWCPQCRELEKDIIETGVPSGVSIIKVDYDSHQSLRQKYGVTIQTTFVRIDDNGNLVKKFTAYDEPTLESVTKNLL